MGQLCLVHNTKFPYIVEYSDSRQLRMHIICVRNIASPESWECLNFTLVCVFVITRFCVCVCVCVCISMTLEPKYVITVSRRGTYFWDGRHACATKCKKCEEGKAYVLLR